MVFKGVAAGMELQHKLVVVFLLRHRMGTNFSLPFTPSRQAQLLGVRNPQLLSAFNTELAFYTSGNTTP